MSSNPIFKQSLRKLCENQWDIVESSRPLALAGEGTEPLHDIRVAVNRFRSLLSFSRALLDEKVSGRLSKNLRQWTKKMGDARDLDVWISFLQACSKEPDAVSRPSFKKSLAYYLKRREQSLSTLNGILSGMVYNSIQSEVKVFFRWDFWDKPGLTNSFFELLSNRKKSLLPKLHALKPSIIQKEAKELHKLRIKFKRHRYLAEFLSNLKEENNNQKLAVHLKSMTHCLGLIHDMDIFSNRYGHESGHIPSKVLTYMSDTRGANLKLLQEAIKNLQSFLKP